MNILLSSAGRRPYLVRWFNEAMRELDVNGTVFVTDSDYHSPSRSFAQEFIQAPKLSDPDYDGWLASLLEQHEIELALSINDFELSKWAIELPRKKELSSLIRLTAARQLAIEDKVTTYEMLTKATIPVPRTFLATELEEILDTCKGPFVVKGRFGSGSRGLNFATPATLSAAIERAASDVTSGRGLPPKNLKEAAEFTVVQPRIAGQEYGLDIITNLQGDYSATLARKKISMRFGETDRASITDSGRFSDLGKQVSSLLDHRGLVDCDVMMDLEGNTWVIDINPRFGGGYPFSHLAGANVPKAYIAWLNNIPIDPSWLRARPHVYSSKFVDIARTDE